MPVAPTDELRRRIEALLGRAVIAATPVHRGYTPAERWVVHLDGGSSAFAKTGADSETSAVATWLRREHEAYERVHADFMPRMLGWDDRDERPLLLLEDLGGATWPPPWDPQRVEAVLATLEQVAASPAPESAPSLEAGQRSRLSGWLRVAEDPRPFLGLGLVTGAWLERGLPALIEAGQRAILEGDRLVHFDVRSDNLCIRDGRAMLLDWPGYARGTELFDRASWLPSLWREGGPAPWTLLPDSQGLATLLAGYFAGQAGVPAIPTAPRVRTVQWEQLQAALPWAARELGLPPLDGARADPRWTG